VGARRRPARDVDRQAAPPLRHRRAAAALERIARRHVDCAAAPERPYFVEQSSTAFLSTCSAKVKAGITGWAQVNGWRGNTSLEKRIEHDLYYIENWSVGLDIKIMWLTVVRGLHRPAF
jgi:lipopolysaccharide/colanic/teichoic acid biosynthesis glycosyltransferase